MFWIKAFLVFCMVVGTGYGLALVRNVLLKQGARDERSITNENVLESVRKAKAARDALANRDNDIRLRNKYMRTE